MSRLLFVSCFAIGKSLFTGNSIFAIISVKFSIKLLNIKIPLNLYKIMKPDILYEDNEIIVLKKPAGIAVQTAKLTQKDMVTELRSYLTIRSGKGEPAYVGVIHRLDQPVGGIIVFGKTKAAAAFLSKQFSDLSAHKEYSAWVVTDNNVRLGDNGSLTNYLIKDSRAGKAVIARENEPGAKKALLDYRVTEEIKLSNGKRLLKLFIILHTGRFHQIRAQLSAAGMYIIGDNKYYADAAKDWIDTAEIRSKAGIVISKGAIALEAVSLTLTHPSSKKIMSWNLLPEKGSCPSG